MIGTFWLTLALSGLGLLLCLGPASAAEKPGALALKTSRVVVFKDGFGLFVKDAAGQAAPDGTVFTDDAPTAATLGSFWVSDREDAISSVVVSRIEREVRDKKRGTCQGILEVVKANLGRPATVTREDGAVLDGKLLSVLETVPPPAVSPSTALWSPSMVSAVPWTPPEEASASEAPPRTPTGELFVLRTSQGDVLVRTKDVRSIRTENMATEIDRELVKNEPANHLVVHFKDAKPGGGRALQLFYFRPGIRWIPTYRVELKDKNQAELSMQAEVLNEAEDLVDTPVDFVVGLPTFKFKDTPSPLSLERVLRNALERAAPQLAGQLAQQQSFSNAVFDNRNDMQPRAMPGRAGAEESAFSVAEKAMEGSEVQDLFYYSTQKLTLKRQERAAVGVFKATVPFRHVYTWDVRLQRGDTFEENNSPLRTEVNKVWHQIVLTNTAGVPWTTGPAMVLEGARPLGQDLLTFTPAKREVILPVTAAVSVRGTVRVEEVSRDRHAERFHGDTYARVVNKATFKAVNSQSSDVHLVLTAQVGGKVNKASDGGKISISGHDPSDYVEDMNPHSVVIWEVNLAAGKTMEVSASYQFFQRE